MASKALGCVVLVVALAIGVSYTSDTHYSQFFGKGKTPGLLNMLLPRSVAKDELNTEVDGYNGKWAETNGERDPSMVNHFYNMVTDFYEYGWGQSFHFAHTYKNETHDDSIRRHEERMADLIKLKPGMTCLDAGSGVGGPARAIAKYSGGNVVGVTINQYQVEKSRRYNKEQGLDHLVRIEQADFTKLPFEDNTFDAAFASEATCHAPELIDVYREVYRTMKPGALFASYEWLTTSRYDAHNETHKKIINGIEFSNGLPYLRNREQVIATANELGFEIVLELDLAEDLDTKPWYYRLEMSTFSQAVTHYVCRVTEWLGLAAKGTTQVHEMLLVAVENLVKGGKQMIFTPMHLWVFRKPAAA
jgi:24-methylenesterol C-methyltransferase